MKAGDYGDAWNWTCASQPKARHPWRPRLFCPLDSLFPPPLQRRLLPKHPKRTCSSSSYTIYRLFLPSTSGSFPFLFLLPHFFFSLPSPNPNQPQLLHFPTSFSASLILRSSSLRKTHSLNFFPRWISLSENLSSDKLRQIRTNSQKCERSGVREKRGGDGAHPSAFGQEEDPRVFTRPHPAAVTERGNLLFLGIIGAFAAVFFFPAIFFTTGSRSNNLSPPREIRTRQGSHLPNIFIHAARKGRDTTYAIMVRLYISYVVN